MRRNRLIFTGLLILTLTATSHAETLSHNPALISVQTGTTLKLDYPGYISVKVAPGLTLPAQRVSIPLLPGENPESMVAFSPSPEQMSEEVSSELLRDATTSSESEYARIEEERNSSNRLGGQPLEVIGEETLGNQRWVEMLLFPVTFDSDGHLWVHPKLDIVISGRQVLTSDLVSPIEIVRPERKMTVNSSAPDYLIVTSSLLADALQPLVTYKNETGYRADLRLIEDVLTQHSGRDDAEKLREMLKGFYAEGGRYVLLAGDETVLPIRYAYPNNAYSMPALDQLQVCDLYFADLTGNWDADGDAIWGEKYADAVDVNPELLVGRLPINSPAEATNYVSKLIRYETDPGAGDRGYLQRAFFFSSDQMRDHAEYGQHGAIAEAYPDWFEIDTVTGVEKANGADPAPTNPNPGDLAPILNRSFGIVNIIAHGRSDGFVLKSAYYNEWPKVYVLTENGVSGHSPIPAFDSTHPAFFYSLACDNGGFDMDLPPMNHANPNLAQALIGGVGGAVGMVAYSRWGWISSSYILQQAFFDSLFAHPERRAVEALYASKEVLYYYRDLVYGLNFYGDPTLRIHTQLPVKPEISIALKENGLEAAVGVDGQSAGICRLLLSEDGVLLSEYTTDLSGRVLMDFPFDGEARYCLSVLIPGACVTQVNFVTSLITDVDDDLLVSLPEQFALYQNYPNPFNPSTNITFDLPVRSEVSVRVFNVLGQQIASLTDGSLEAGHHTLTWDGTTESGEPAASGVYCYRLEYGHSAITRKMILLK